MQEKIIKRFGLDPDTLDFSRPGGQIKTVGYSPAKKKWYGWSHRAVAGFKSKDKAKSFARSVS